ncbi:uncharacterized protein EDB91DRAFT_1239995 [Suillus paluster]|uniref:uncharacterized protein n=1 Tax=Suillus paluster TaxID=48578 RepID=UPI001B86F54C|nr:uncharacterized protein EDB91DRAFT_1239995 [Suillus paluster]KAG1724147.1 hypothetical protein EDB91DRAFT_1239995 [Suillus paluster]
MIIDIGVDFDDEPYTAPPGEEGFDISHEGGEYEVFKGLLEQVASLSHIRYVDPRTCRDRIELQSEQWHSQIDQLVDAYLDYRLRDHGDGMPSIANATPAIEGSDCLSLTGIDLMTLQPQPFHRYPNETLVYHGYLGCSPLYLTVPYCPYLNSQFSDAYDTYLEILYHVDHRLNEALHCNRNWRLLNACPCCTYKLEDEPPLALEWLVCIDDNNSLKRWVSSTYGLTAREDSRKPRSDYWVNWTTVDEFKDEVRRSAPSKSNSDQQDDWEDLGTVPVESRTSFNCTEQWRNAELEQRKKMFSVFDESGIFIAACRHRFVLLACDMVQSGEL